MTFTVLAPSNAAPHNRYQPHPAEPAQHTTCSNIRLVLLKMGILMPETCWEIVENKHLTDASCWFSLSLQNWNLLAICSVRGPTLTSFNCVMTSYIFRIVPMPACVNIVWIAVVTKWGPDWPWIHLGSTHSTCSTLTIHSQSTHSSLTVHSFPLHYTHGPLTVQL